MGTRLDLVFPGMDEKMAEGMISRIGKEVDRVEQKLSIFQPDSAISMINALAPYRWVPLDDELDSIFNEIIGMNRETEGYFDITLKPVYDLLMIKKMTETNDLVSLKKKTGMDKLEIKNKAIRFRNSGVQLDFGGYGKGYAVRRILQILKGLDIDSVLISFGESMIYGLGTHPFGDRWKVSVPYDGKSGPAIYDLRNEALSTSGNTLNNQKKFGNSGHILDPGSFRMRDEPGLVCVKTSDPVRAEIFSTAFFAAGMKQSEAICKDRSDLELQWLHPVIKED